ncbi:MAG TPA: FliM/FliN family flagellar motor switch protein [Solirubrobacteraceae bacterium]|jgi:flagellar motor switch protein FliN/FliY|nr:FliM/FliN family flagellar motor switch protein [Solirubrobacteraceae bacterium]
MGATDMTPRDALMRLGASTAEAIAQVLEMFAPGTIERGDVSVMGEGQSPFNGIAPGSVAASVSYVDGVTGANIFVLTAAGVRNMAQAMGMPAPEGGDSDELSELELSAVGEASNQMMSAAASAIGVVLGQEIEISPPDIRVLDNPDAVAEMYGSSPHATSTTFLIGGESCRLIQLVPRAFVVRMARALDELDGETVDSDSSSAGDGAGRGKAQTMALEEALTGIKVRVWAELGRTQLGLSRALGLPLGSVVELDQPADAPVDLYVNGLPFAQGHLIITDDGEWAFQCDTVGVRAVPEAPPRQEPAPEIFDETFDEAPEVVTADEAVEADPAGDAAGDTAAVTPAAPPPPNNEEGAAD